MALVLVVLTLCVCAQEAAASPDVQEGIVRTIKRPGRDAVCLSGVSIRRQGGHNAVVSDSAGKFELVMPDMTVGQPFYLSYIRKSGYELADNGTIGRAFTYSPEVPIEIVMVDLRAKEADVMRITKNAYARAEKEYSKKLSELEAGLESKTVSEESYREQLRQLQESFEKYESLIGKMAERYASTDYADIDSLNASINIAIESGDLERADSLLSTVGSLDRLVEENRSAMTSAHERQRVGRKLVAEAEEDIRKIESDRARLGDLLYSKYSVCLSRFNNDSAAHYILLRADLDTTNAQWQLDAGNFLFEYKADYKYSLSLFQRALRNFLEKYGDNSPEVANIYAIFGILLPFQGDFSGAFEMFKRTLEINKSVYGENHPVVAENYRNIGYTYQCFRDLLTALEMYKRSFEINKSVYGDSSPEVAVNYIDIGNIYYYQGEFSKALEMYERSIEINKSVYGDSHENIARASLNIGNIYSKQGEYLKAMEMYRQSLEIMKSVHGNKSLSISLIYKSIGRFYEDYFEYTKAIEMYKQFLEISKSIYGENHPVVAAGYNDIGGIYYYQREFSKALEMYERSIEICKSIFGDSHKSIANLCHNIGQVYTYQGKFLKALEMYKRSLEINKSVYGDNSIEAAGCYIDVGNAYFYLDEYSKALEMYTSSIEINKYIYRDNHHHNIAVAYQNMGNVYFEQNEYSKALRMYRHSHEIYKKIYGKNNPITIDVEVTIKSIKSAEKNDGR